MNSFSEKSLKWWSINAWHLFPKNRWKFSDLGFDWNRKQGAVIAQRMQIYYFSWQGRARRVSSSWIHYLAISISGIWIHIPVTSCHPNYFTLLCLLLQLSILLTLARFFLVLGEIERRINWRISTSKKLRWHLRYSRSPKLAGTTSHLLESSLILFPVKWIRILWSCICLQQ